MSAMPSELYALIGIIGAAIISAFVALRAQKSTNRSATAGEVSALGDRLDKQAIRMDLQDEKIARLEHRGRLLREYVYVLQALLRRNKIPVPDPPDNLF